MPIPHVGIFKHYILIIYNDPDIYGVPYASQNISDSTLF